MIEQEKVSLARNAGAATRPAFWKEKAFSPAFLCLWLELATLALLVPVPRLLVQCSGGPGINYTLQSAPDLANWPDLAMLPAGTNGTFQCFDASVANYSKRFYRLKYL
jgi:hypothetical protein